MFRTKLIPATMAAALALGTATFAYAASSESEHAKEASAVLGAKTSLSQAISAAEKQTGGRAMKVDMGHEKGAYLYEIQIVSKDKVSEVFVDPASGKITRTDAKGMITKKTDQAEFAKLAGSSVTLAAAIATAEKETGGKAIDAAFESKGGKLQFAVEVSKDKAEHKVMIEAPSGKVLKVSAAEEGKSKTY